MDVQLKNGVVIDFDKGEIFKNGEVIHKLTAKEFKTLEYFVNNCNRILNTEQILSSVWGYENDKSGEQNVRDIIKKIRSIDDSFEDAIETRTGLGYIMHLPEQKPFDDGFLYSVKNQKKEKYMINTNKGTMLGRQAGSCDIILADERASRIHAQIFARRDGLYIVDMGSSNGTFLNEKRLGENPEKINVGDVIKCGDIKSEDVFTLEAAPKINSSVTIINSHR
ncbi:MAG: FHA domain-containing protein [Butyrivibrio sp.]|uniref:FHA domain-containing protein n=1 Tax=Butyrivibrio sp. TaxID=28121 RepID=UPI001B15DCAB|nr:FHA domain-containing protein [Butyrivibrio sp.]MBO6241543.1 FHA domain-containing protein [Butyrivibrio sp.]